MISKHIFAGTSRLVTCMVTKEEVDGKEVWKESGRFYTHPDHLGSSSLITNMAGSFHEQLEYFPYGEMWVQEKVSSEAYSTPYKFTGKEQDAETGLYYYGARYYDPVVSRWISADDRFDDLFRTMGLNIYGYVHGNPVRFIDPDGHVTVKDRKTKRTISSTGLNNGKSNFYDICGVKILPTSGGERKYEPKKWNDSGEIQKSANCTAYMADERINPITGVRFGNQNDKDVDDPFYQPGMLSGKSYKYERIVEYMQDDFSLLKKSFKKIGKYNKASKKGYKVALFLHPSTKNYHWMRQNKDGTWSHKNNVQEASNADDTNMIIYDPEDTNFTTDAGWIFGGYYEVSEN